MKKFITDEDGIQKEVELTFQNMEIDDIINWCQANGEDAIEWLKKEAKKEVECKIYPRKKVVNEKGKKVSVADKSQEPKIEMRPISFVQIKIDFCEEFMKELAPKKEKKANMFDRIANL